MEKLIDEIEVPLGERPHGLDRLERMGWDMLEMIMLLTLVIIINIFFAIILYGRLIKIHPYDTFNYGSIVKVSIINIIMII